MSGTVGIPVIHGREDVKMSGVDNRRYVTVPVTALWASPTAPRDLDAWAVAAQPDVVAWLADLDAAGARTDLHGRLLTQLECCEPVLLIGDPNGLSDGRSDESGERRWLQIAAPMQPSTLDTRGYPGWLLAGHVGAQMPSCPPLATVADSVETGIPAEAFIEMARTHLGLPYLWGGLSDQGLDCSGLVHLSLRRLGLVVPRDADDQYDACEHILAADARPGDLYFFAHQNKRPHHVGIVTGPGRMLHAPETGSVVVEEALTAARQSTLIGAGRLPLPPPPAGRAG